MAEHHPQEEGISRSSTEHQPTSQVSSEETQTPVVTCVSPNIPSPVTNHVSRGPVTRSLARKHPLTPIEHPRSNNKPSTDNDSASCICDVVTVDPVQDYRLDSISDTSSTSSIMEEDIELDRFQPVSNSAKSDSTIHTIDLILREVKNLHTRIQSQDISD